MKNTLTFIGLIIICPFLLNAQTDSTSDVNTLKKLSLEELMDVKVVTASG